MRCNSIYPKLAALLIGVLSAGVAATQDNKDQSPPAKSGSAETVPAPKPDQPGTEKPQPKDAATPPNQTDRPEQIPAPPVITINQITRLTFQEKHLRLDAELDYTIDQAAVSQLALTVPEDIVVDRVASDAVRGFHMDAEHSRLVIDLKQPAQGRLHLAVSGSMPLETGGFDETQLLPLLTPEKISSETGKILIYAPAGMKVIPDDEVIGAQTEPSVSEDEHLGAQLASAWRYQQRPVEVSVRTKRQTPRIAAAVATTLDVAFDHVGVTTQIQFDVDRGTPDVLRFAVPEAVAERVRLSQIRRSDRLVVGLVYPDAQATDGWITWNIRIPHKSTAHYAIELRYTIPVDGRSGGPQTLAIPISRTLPARNAHQTDVPLESVSGEILVTGRNDVSFAAETTGDGIQLVDLDTLSLRSDRGRLAYRYADGPVEIKLTAQRSEFPPGVKTAVSSAVVDVVIGSGKQISWRSSFRLATRERQRLRIDVPQGSQILGAFIDGRETSLRLRDGATPQEGWDAYDIDVVRAGSAALPFTLSIRFVSQAPLRTFAARGGNMHLRLPRIDGDEHAIVTQQSELNVWIPSGFALVSQPTDYAKAQQHRVRELFFRARGKPAPADAAGAASSGPAETDFPTSGHVYRYTRIGGPVPLEITWWDMSFYTWITSGALVLIALVVVNTSRRNKFAILGALALILAAYAFFNSERGWHILLAGRMGVIGMLTVWLIRAGIDCCPDKRSSATAQPPARGANVPITDRSASAAAQHGSMEGPKTNVPPTDSPQAAPPAS